jgi:FkbM family methyltransferase
MSLSGIYKKGLFHISAKLPGLYALFFQWFYQPSKGSMSEVISQFSKANPELSFLQVGANDGFNHDPIHKFIRRDGWKGILLEPQKEVFENKLIRLHEKSRGIVCLNAAMDIVNGEKQLYKISFSKHRWATGLSSFNKEVLLEAISSGHVMRSSTKEGITPPTNQDDWIVSEPVQTISPQNLKNQYGLNQIDFLQIDTEGFDFEIIKMVINAGFSPKMIVFEHSHFTSQDLINCTEFLIENNYRVQKWGGNSLALSHQETGYENYFSI